LKIAWSEWKRRWIARSAGPSGRRSLRSLFVVLACTAALAAWCGTEIRRSQAQAKARNALANLGAQVQSVPSSSLFVALLPGSPSEPPAAIRRMLGRDIFTELSDVALIGKGGTVAANVSDFREAIKNARTLKSVQLQGITLGTDDLTEVFQLPELELLNVSHTRLDQQPIAEIANTSLRWFNGSHTWLGDQAAYDLSFCQQLENIYMDRTTLTDAGLEYLTRLKNLRHLSVLRTHVSLAAVTKFAAEMPDCFIDYEPLVFDSRGRQDAAASMKGKRNFGVFRPFNRSASAKYFLQLGSSFDPNWEIYSRGYIGP
jgi:hypothetical protein